MSSRWPTGPVPLPVCASVCPPPKGLAWPGELPCIGVSTLEAMAWNLAHVDGVICCAMDARRKQVYNALFEAKDGQLTRLTPDRAISLEELFHGETVEKRPQILVGDGAELCYNDASPLGLPVRLGSPRTCAISAPAGSPVPLGSRSSGQVWKTCRRQQPCKPTTCVCLRQSGNGWSG